MKLTNGEVLDASAKLAELRKLKLPIKTSSDLVKMALKLDEPIKAYDEVRKGLVETYQIYGEESEDLDKDGNKIQLIKTKGKAEDLQKFITEMNELLKIESEVVITKVKLPEKIAGTCDACSHNMDVPLQIEGDILLSLDKLIEVV